jgi:hypothetical protein
MEIRMLRTRDRRAGTIPWGAVALCFSTLCVCATAVVITQMILSRQPAEVPSSAPQAAGVGSAGFSPSPREQDTRPEGRTTTAVPAPPTPAPTALEKVEGNLVRNGGFETLGGEGSSLFEGWGYWGRWENGNYTLESAPGHTGKHGAKMSCVTPGRGGISQKLEGAKPGDKLKITFWAKADKAVGGRLFLNLEGTPGEGMSQTPLK